MKHILARFLLNSAVAGLLSLSIAAQDFRFFPGMDYDPLVPTMQAVLGHRPGSRISSHRQTVRYIHALAEASPLVSVHKYGATWEGRELYYLVVTSNQNHARLARVQAGLQKLADPRKLEEAEAKQLIEALPAVTWLAHSVHGDEISCTDAALFLAYHLAAAKDDEISSKVLEHSIVIIDPLQNPDGRERFLASFTQMQGRWPDAEPTAAEHDQPWPGGRTNHYWFDMNRDWIAMTQPETRARIASYLEWWPVVFVDLHEMGSNSSYFFSPPAKPYNPEFTKHQIGWLERYGRNNGRWFDRFGFDYFTREIFDTFYPGYGEGWPMFHGAVGMTYEQASVRGLVVRRDDESRLRYEQSVQRHFIGGLATAETTARNRKELLQGFYDFRRTAIEEGEKGPIVEFVLPPGRDRGRAAKLARLLARQGIEVHQATSELKNERARSIVGGEAQARTFPKGSYVVRLAQPAKRLATTLLSRQQDMEPEFVEEQKRRYRERRRTQIYDVTSWSLPLLYGVECYACGADSKGEVTRVVPRSSDSPAIEPRQYGSRRRAKVAYVLASGQNNTARALAELLRREVRVHCADKKFRIGEREFDAGSLIVKVHDNKESVHALVHALDAAFDLDLFLADSSWVDEGISFGSNRVRYLIRPKVLCLCDRPARAYSTGWARYLLEQAYGYPVTMVRTRTLGRVELHRYNVLILPSGGNYGSSIDKALAARIKEWIRAGGTLITLGGGATKWLTGKEVGLLATETEKRKRPGEEKTPEGEAPATKPSEKQEKKEKAEEPFDYEKAILPEKEEPGRTPGAILAVILDVEHWLAFGCGSRVNVVSTSRDIYTPVKLDKGRNVGVFEKKEKLFVSGFVWEDKLEQLAQKAWLVHQPLGRGHVVAFAEDPNFRAFQDGTDLFFLNAVLLGPGH